MKGFKAIRIGLVHQRIAEILLFWVSNIAAVKTHEEKYRHDKSPSSAVSLMIKKLFKPL